jgi:hypothetical protein
MGLFDFMGTFFFVSLGITFVLILMLVYHFKQRLSESEQKSDKMFEIINTIVKEMGNMKRAIAQCSTDVNRDYSDTAVCPRDEMPFLKREYEFDGDDADDADADDDDCEGNVVCSQVHRDRDVIELSIGNNAYDADDGNQFQNNDYNEEKEEGDDSDSRGEVNVKLVNVDLTYNGDDILTDNEQSVSEFELDVENENVDAPVIVPELTTAFGEELIHVNKLDEIMKPDESESESSSEEEKMSYHKMSLVQLRAYAVSRGVLSDSSKMKKMDLIKLLENNDEY